MDLFAQATVTENQPHAKPESTQATSKPDNTLSVLSESKSQEAENVQPAQANNSAADTTTNQKITPTVNENTIYEISSWWKFGASAEMMKTDMNTCVASLGDAHKPNPVAQTYTRAFVVCMFQKGWKGLKANKT